MHERLAKLSNRLDATAQAKVLGDIHGRIPMVTPEEQRALQLRNAEADERFWTQLHDLHAGTVEGQKGLAVSAERKVAALRGPCEDFPSRRQQKFHREERRNDGRAKSMQHQGLKALQPQKRLWARFSG